MSRPATERAIAKMTGLKIVPGTLNVRLPKAFTGRLPLYVSVEELGGLPGVTDRKGLKIGRVRIEGRFKGFVFQGDEADFSPFDVELISDRKLRQELNLSDGDSIKFELIE